MIVVNCQNRELDELEKTCRFHENASLMNIDFFLRTDKIVNLMNIVKFAKLVNCPNREVADLIEICEFCKLSKLRFLK